MPIAPDNMPCLARMRIRPVSCPGKKVGSESAGTRKYIAAAMRKMTPRGARGSVNRVLKKWERAGWLVVKDRTILIVNRAALEASTIEEDI